MHARPRGVDRVAVVVVLWPPTVSSGVSFKLAPANRPYARLYVSQAGKIGFGNRHGRFGSMGARMRPRPPPGDPNAAAMGAYVAIVSLGNPKKPNRTGAASWCLGVEADSVSADGGRASLERHDLIASMDRAAVRWIHDAGVGEDASLFHAEEVDVAAASPPAPALPLAPAPALPLVPVTGAPTAPLQHTAATTATVDVAAFGADATAQQISARFHRDGYVCAAGAVVPSVVNAAISRINRGLGTPGSVVAGGVQPGVGKLEGGAPTARELLELFNSKAGRLRRLLDIVIGPNMYELPRGCQIALRFPDDGPPPDDTSLPGNEWHTDGMRQGKRHPFTLLVGVALSSVSAPFHGNLAVFPGSHHRLHDISLANGRLKDVDEDQPFSKITTRDNSWGVGVGLPDLGPPRQLLLEPGDALLAHSKLAHRGCPNFSPSIRHMVYFRVRHRDHATTAMQYGTPDIPLGQFSSIVSVLCHPARAV